MIPYTLADPRTGRVFYVGEATNLHQAIGNLLLRPPGNIKHIMTELDAAGFVPEVKEHDLLTKAELLAKHARTTCNTGRRGPEPAKIREAAIEYNQKLVARSKRKGLPVGDLGHEIMRRSLAWARRQKL